MDNEYADSILHITDGAATACFHSSGHGNPVVASLEILQIYDDAYNLGPMANLNVIMRTVKRVTAGAQQSGYGANLQADPWGGDRYWATDQTIFTPGSHASVIRTQRNISKFSTPPNIYPQAIYQSATTTLPMNQLSYTIPVQPNQNYSIWIHLAEIDPYITSSNERIFDVLVNGAPLFQAVDIVMMAGAQYTALILNKTILVEGRTLTISFVPLAGAISVNAFEVYQIIMTEYPTFDANGGSCSNTICSISVSPALVLEQLMHAMMKFLCRPVSTWMTVLCDVRCFGLCIYMVEPTCYSGLGLNKYNEYACYWVLLLIFGWFLYSYRWASSQQRINNVGLRVQFGRCRK